MFEKLNALPFSPLAVERNYYVENLVLVHLKHTKNTE